MKNKKIQDWLSRSNGFVFSAYAIIAAFSTYACMYAFRKPLSAAGYSDYSLWGVDYKIIILISQVLGYTLSKYMGVKIISEMKGNRRAISILVLIGLAEVALFLFAVVPYPYNFVFLFFNGMPLGMIWGLVFSYLEGRRYTEALGAGLSVSFVVSSGVVKSIGKAFLSMGISEFWMPFLTGAIFILPLIFFVWMLDQIPPPNAKDIELRTERVPMNRKERHRFLKTFAPGLIMLVAVYMLLTAFRDFRDNFMADIWNELQIESSMIFTYTEIPIALVMLVIMGMTMLIKDNMKALMVNHYLIMIGMLLVGGSTWLFAIHSISPVLWMILVGLGGYLAYIPFNCILFDRLIAAFKYKSNAGFLIYVADAFGYTAAIGVMLFKDFGFSDMSWLKFFMRSSYAMAFISLFLCVLSMVYFIQRYRSWKKHPEDFALESST